MGGREGGEGGRGGREGGGEIEAGGRDEKEEDGIREGRE